MGNRNSGRKPWHSFENAYEDLTGRTFGRWTVLSRANNTEKWGHIQWWCLCQCGYKARVQGKTLKSGRSRSCGCLKTELVREQVKRQWADGTWKRRSA